MYKKTINNYRKKENQDFCKPSFSHKVAVFLCTCNGERFLSKQLDSIKAQNFENLTIHASDDGSKDETCNILEQYQQKFGGASCFSIYPGPQKGFVANFLSLVCNKEIEADYFAYSDQDDLWEPDKLSRAIAKLKRVPDNVPGLYCSRTLLIDENGSRLGFSPLFKRPSSFTNALVQNIGGGNTMVMNKAACELLRAAGEKSVVSHDWWSYLLVSGTGGIVIYDPYPSVQYRQHAQNQVGSNASIATRMVRIKMLFRNRFRKWNTINIRALLQISHLLTKENQNILYEFDNAREKSLLLRLLIIWKLGLHRQTLIDNVGLIVAILFKKI